MDHDVQFLIDGKYQTIIKEFNYPVYEFIESKSSDLIFIHYLGVKALTSGIFEYDQDFIIIILENLVNKNIT